MRILFIATYEGLSGASYSLIGMINELRKYHIDPMVILLKSGKLENKLRENNIPYMIVRGYPWVISKERKSNIKYRFFWLIKKIINIKAEHVITDVIQKNNIELLHINASTASIGFAASKKTKIPCVWHIREFVEEDLGKEFWNKTKAMECLSKATTVIAISKCVRDKFKTQLAKSAHIEVIYNGISILPYIKERNTPIFSSNQITIIISGRIDPGKGHIELIDALELIIKNGMQNICLQIVGKSQQKEYEDYIKKYVLEKKLEKNISFLGYREDVPDLYKKADISIVASKAEAFGRVTVEAMMAGTLVIGANTAGTKELINDTYGLLYEQGNAVDLANKIIFAIKNKDKMSEIALNAKEYALKNFSALKNAEQVLEVYSTILDR